MPAHPAHLLHLSWVHAAHAAHAAKSSHSAQSTHSAKATKPAQPCCSPASGRPAAAARPRVGQRCLIRGTCRLLRTAGRWLGSRLEQGCKGVVTACCACVCWLAGRILKRLQRRRGKGGTS